MILSDPADGRQSPQQGSAIYAEARAADMLKAEWSIQATCVPHHRSEKP